ncbi:hypothetical protein I310_02475 [Cryptococcus deuterogattii CA1014]|nr:hypothetical protein I310_02475 [Cryptococcus deuterogattii CA1014]
MAAAVATEESKYKRNPEVFVRPKMPAINPEKQADSCQEEKRRISANVSSSDRRTTCLFARRGETSGESCVASKGGPPGFILSNELSRKADFTEENVKLNDHDG